MPEQKKSSLRGRLEHTRKTHAKPIKPTPVIIGIVFVALAGIGLYVVFQKPATPSRKPSSQPGKTQPAVCAPKPAAPEATEPKTPEVQPKDQPAPAKAPPQPVTFEVTHGDVAEATEAKDQPATAKAAPALIIVRAVYGDLQSARIADVTEKVKGMATADGLAVVASNGNFSDPASGTVKQLRIEYTLDGEQMEKAVRENETLTIGSSETQPAVSALAVTVAPAEALGLPFGK